MPIIIQTTFSNKKEAINIAKKLCEKHLVACAHISKIDSIYRWNGELQQDKEFLLSLKTSKKHKKNLIYNLKKYHPYNVPQIIILTIDDMSKAYKRWFKETLRA